MNVPRVTNGIEEGANGAMFAGSPDSVNLPNLGPSKIAPATKQNYKSDLLSFLLC